MSRDGIYRVTLLGSLRGLPQGGRMGTWLMRGPDSGGSYIEVDVPTVFSPHGTAGLYSGVQAGDEFRVSIQSIGSNLSLNDYVLFIEYFG